MWCYTISQWGVFELPLDVLHIGNRKWLARSRVMMG